MAGLAACATTPQRNAEVEQARGEIDTLSQDPFAQQAAGADLEAARKNLQQAETALQQDQPAAVVDHLAYLAKRHAETGLARAQEARSRQEVARAQEERNKILVDERTREAMNAQAQADAARSQAADSQAQAADSQAQAEAARSQAQATQAQADAARSQAADSQAQLADAQQQLAQTQQQLQDLQTKKTDRGVVATLGDVLFDTGQASLKPGADRSLNRLATFLSGHPDTKIMIEGHTDSRGSDDYNLNLSQRRADAVASALESRGLSADHVQTRGLGKSFPVASNDTPEGRQQNRRVEIVFSDASGNFASGAGSTTQR